MGNTFGDRFPVTFRIYNLYSLLLISWNSYLIEWLFPGTPFIDILMIHHGMNQRKRRSIVWIKEKEKWSTLWIKEKEKGSKDLKKCFKLYGRFIFASDKKKHTCSSWSLPVNRNYTEIKKVQLYLIMCGWPFLAAWWSRVLPSVSVGLVDTILYACLRVWRSPKDRILFTYALDLSCIASSNSPDMLLVLMYKLIYTICSIMLLFLSYCMYCPIFPIILVFLSYCMYCPICSICTTCIVQYVLLCCFLVTACIVQSVLLYWCSLVTACIIQYVILWYCSPIYLLSNHSYYVIVPFFTVYFYIFFLGYFMYCSICQYV